jgi:hypothetical protein
MPHGYIWYSDPGVFVTQAHMEHAKLEHVVPMSEYMDSLFVLKRTELGELGGLLIVHDWRTVKSYDTETRKFLITRLQERKRGLVRGVIIAVSMNPFLRMAVQVASAIMSASAGGRLQMVESLTPALIEHGVRAPSASARFPGR